MDSGWSSCADESGEQWVATGVVEEVESECEESVGEEDDEDELETERMAMVGDRRGFGSKEKKSRRRVDRK